MRFTDQNRVALGALFRYPLRTAMMLLATAIGVAAVVVLTGLGEAVRLYVTDEFRSLGTNLLIVLPGRTETTPKPPSQKPNRPETSTFQISPEVGIKLPVVYT